MSQSHFTLRFPLKSSANVEHLTNHLRLMMPALFQAEDAIGTIHFSCFTILSGKTVLFLGDFDGEFATLMSELAERAGPVFDALFGYVESPPALPVSGHARAYVEWAACRLVQPLSTYTAYPDITAKEINDLVDPGDQHCKGAQQAFLMVLPARSSLAFLELQLLLQAQGRSIMADLDNGSVPHFAQIIPLEDEQIGFFGIHDCRSENHMRKLARSLGPTFDLMFKFIKNPPPSPCHRHVSEFVEFTAAARRVPIGFYQAYPTMTVRDIYSGVLDQPIPLSHQ